MIDLHGRVDVVRCLACERRIPRAAWWGVLEQAATMGSGGMDAASAERWTAAHLLARIATKQGAGADAIHILEEVLAEEKANAADPVAWISTATALAQALRRADRNGDALPLARSAWEASQTLQSLPTRAAAGYSLAACQLATNEIDSLSRFAASLTSL